MIEIKLPSKPKDKYRLDWWQLSISEHWYYIKRMHAIYYINTSYEELFPGERRGAPPVDDWMLYEDNHATGRWVGWKSPESHDNKYRFETEGEAKEEALHYLKEAINYRNEQIKHIEVMVRDLTVP